MKSKCNSSIFKRIWIPLLILVIFQTILLTAVFIGGGVINRLNQNAIDIVNEKTITRTKYLEEEMLGRWSKLDSFVKEINDRAQAYAENSPEKFQNMEKDSDNYIPFLDSSMETLISLMRNNAVNGAFIVLNQQDLTEDITSGNYQDKPGIYLRDYDPSTFPSKENDDLMAERMPEALVKKWKISTDLGWKDKFLFSGLKEGYYPFFSKTYQTARSHPEMSSRNLGYWSNAYKLDDDVTQAISYSVPLRLEDGTIYGILGIEITLDYLKKIVPYNELTEDGSGAYVLGIEKNESNKIQSVMVNGPVFRMSVKDNDEIQLKKMKKYKNTYCIDGKKGDLICSQKQFLNLYNSNTPYAKQQWVLTGISSKSYLFNFSNKIKNLLLIMITVMFVLSVLSVSFISFLISRPVKNLAEEIDKSHPDQPIHLPETKIQELNLLKESVERLSQDLFESSHKFTQILKMARTGIGGFEIEKLSGKLFITDDFFQIFYPNENIPNPSKIGEFEDEIRKLNQFIDRKNENVYIFKIPQNGRNRWIRLTIQLETDKIMGLAEDITKETLELHQTEYERDHDLLTGIINRRAFYSKMEELFADYQYTVKTAAMIMIDLDNLKHINDTYGHDYGDQYIKSAAENIARHAPENSVVARMSGDEFIVFVYGYESEEEAHVAIEKSVCEFQGEVLQLPDGKEAHLYMSGGIAWYPRDSKDYHQLIKYADFAMYQRKKSKKGTFGQFSMDEFLSKQRS